MMAESSQETDVNIEILYKDTPYYLYINVEVEQFLLVIYQLVIWLVE